MDPRYASQTYFRPVLNDFGGNTSVIKHADIWVVLISGHTLITFTGDSQIVRSDAFDAYTGLGALYTVLNCLATWTALCDNKCPAGVKIIHQVMVFGAKVTYIRCAAGDTITQNSSAAGASADSHRNRVCCIHVIATIAVGLVVAWAKNAVFNCCWTVDFALPKGFILVSPETFAWFCGILNGHIVYHALTCFCRCIKECKKRTVTTTAYFSCGYITRMTCVVSASYTSSSAGPYRDRG